MSSPRSLTFYHSPNTRSTAVLMLLDELEAPYDLKTLNLKAGEQRQPGFLAVNPMGKVPTIVHGDSLVTEQAAAFIYLADLFPKKNLAPAFDSPLRGPYLRWLTFYGSSFEPAVVDKALKREPGSPMMMPYGDFDTTLKTVQDNLRRHPYVTGDTITAADILWGNALSWITSFKLVPETPEIVSYIKRITDRPSYARAKAKDAELAAKFGN